MGGASPGNGATRPPAACRASLYQEGHVASAGWRRWLLIPQQGLRSTLKWCDIRGVAGRPGGAEEAEGPRPCCPSPPHLGSAESWGRGAGVSGTPAAPRRGAACASAQPALRAGRTQAVPGDSLALGSTSSRAQLCPSADKDCGFSPSSSRRLAARGAVNAASSVRNYKRRRTGRIY